MCFARDISLLSIGDGEVCFACDIPLLSIGDGEVCFACDSYSAALNRRP